MHLLVVRQPHGRLWRAQQPAMPVIGILSNPSHNALPAAFALFHRGLKDAGYVEGQNVAIEYRFADGQVDRLPALATDLVNRKVDVLVAMANAAALAAKTVTTAIPVVFVIGGDPGEAGPSRKFQSTRRQHHRS